MIKKEVDGRIFYCFDASEIEARREFERSMVAEDTLKQITQALMEASTEMYIKKLKAWESAKRQVELNLDEDDNINRFELEYNWILGGFTIHPYKEEKE